MWREFQPSYVLLDGTTSGKLLNKPYFSPFLPAIWENLYRQIYLSFFPTNKYWLLPLFAVQKEKTGRSQNFNFEAMFPQIQHCFVHFCKFAWGIKVEKVKQVMLNWPKKSLWLKERSDCEVKYFCVHFIFFLCTLLNHKCTLWCPPLL